MKLVESELNYVIIGGNDGGNGNAEQMFEIIQDIEIN